MERGVVSMMRACSKLSLSALGFFDSHLGSIGGIESNFYVFTGLELWDIDRINDHRGDGLECFAVFRCYFYRDLNLRLIVDDVSGGLNVGNHAGGLGSVFNQLVALVLWPENEEHRNDETDQQKKSDCDTD